MNENLQSLLDLGKNLPSRKEFLSNFSEIITYIKSMDAQLSSTVGMIHSALNARADKIHQEHSQAVADLKGQVDSVFVNKRLAQIEKDLHSKVNTKLATVRNGKDGIGIKGDQGDPGLNGIDANETAIHDRVVRTLTPLLEKQTSTLEAKIPKTVQTPAKVYRTITADLSSQCDGNTKTFNVGGMHFGIVGVYSTEFPQIYRPIIDYTETRNGFMLTSQVSAPASGQTLVALFLK